MKRKPIVALIYDFDGTLSPGNMQEFGFIQAVGKTADEFWRMSDSIAIGQDASNVLAYMKLMFDEAKRNGIKLRGHTLIWHNQIGSWMCRDENGKLLSKEEFYANMKHHIQAIVSRYKDVVFCWDVVNEAVADSPVAPGRPELRDSPMYKIAGEEFIYKAFEILFYRYVI